MTFLLDGFPVVHRRMEMDVPPCPACGDEDAAIREKVLRGDTEIAFWCCPPCGARWRDRVADGMPTPPPLAQEQRE